MTNDSIDFSNVDWETMVPRLTLFALFRLQHLTWLGERYGATCKGMEPGDFVNEAVSKTLSGTRKWNRDITLYKHLTGVISSDISNLINGSENKKTARYAFLSEDIDEYSYDSITDLTIVEFDDPATLFKNKKELENLLAFVEINGPHLSELLVLTGVHGIRNAVELSVRLEKTVEEVNNLKKQLRRILYRYLREPETG